MDKIWANCIVRGTKTLDEVPAIRITGVKAELQARVDSGAITAEKYTEITGDTYEVSGS